VLLNRVRIVADCRERQIYFQVSRRTIADMLDRVTEKSLAISPCRSPFSARARIDRMSECFSLAWKHFSPRLSVPCKILSCWFSSGVPQAKLSMWLFVLQPSKCLHCIPPGHGPTNVVSTKMCTVICFGCPLWVSSTL